MNRETIRKTISLEQHLLWNFYPQVDKKQRIHISIAFNDYWNDKIDIYTLAERINVTTEELHKKFDMFLNHKDLIEES